MFKMTCAVGNVVAQLFEMAGEEKDVESHAGLIVIAKPVCITIHKDWIKTKIENQEFLFCTVF